MTDERIVRLVSDGGSDGMSGGGFPLPDAFAAVLQQLLESGTTSYVLLAKKITDKPLIQINKDRIIAIWKSWDAFTEDVIVTLDQGKFIRASDSRGIYWDLGGAFKEGESLEVITSQEVKDATDGVSSTPVTVTVFDSGARAERNEIAKAVMAINKCKAEIARQGKMTIELENHFFQITGILEGRKDTRPPQPEDQPEYFVKCLGSCEKELPQTRKNFFLYWSRDKWYWRTKCRDCIANPKDRVFQEELITIVNSILEENGGMFPRDLQIGRDIAARMGRTKDISSIYGSWDRLTARGLLPPRP